ncbi:MAG: major capsid protein [Atribacterota bacterium]|nr:major capsid protein [Atribacterota bacterium]
MPELENVHKDAILTNISVMYRNAAYVGTEIMPIVPVKKKSDIYYIYDSKDDRFRVPQTLRAPKTESRTVDWKVTTGGYVCDEHALNDLIDDIERDNADKPLNLEVDTVEFLTDILQLGLEMRIKDMLEASLSANAPTNGVWSDYTTTTINPIADIEIAKAAIHAKIFREPNVLLLGKAVYDKLKHHPKIIELIKYSQKGVLTSDLMASLFGIEKVIVGEAGYNTAKEGKTAVLSYLWGKNAILAYVEPRPGIKKFSLGYTFQAQKFQTRRARIELKHSDWFEVGDIETEKLICVDCGYRISPAIA